MGLKRQSFDGIYRGVVENNVDPDKLGRVQVRIVGIHDESKKDTLAGGIPTSNLPWAEPCHGLFEGSVSGCGIFTVPLQGSHVFLFFENSNWECPRYFTTSPGKPSDSPNPDKGFNDPSGVYPKYTNESDVHRLARNENTEDTILSQKSAKRISGIPGVNGTWDEPASTYNAVYPENIVISTHSDITIELDNSPGSKRIHIYHPSGTYIEIDDTGNVTFKSEGDRFDVTKNKLYTSASEINSSSTGNTTQYVGAQWDVKAIGDINVTAGGNATVTAVNINAKASGSATVEAATSTTITSPTIALNGAVTINGAVVMSGGSVTMNGGDIVMSGGSVTMNGIVWSTHKHGTSPGPTN